MSWIAVGVAAVAVVGSQFATKKPKVPGFESIDAQEQQVKAIEGNQAALPKAQALATDVNAFNQDAILKQLRAVVPNFDDLLGQTGKNIGSQLKGEIPEDVAGNIYRGNVAKGLASGTGASSPRTSNLTARDLGLTSLAIKDKGFDSLTRWIGTAKQNLSAPIVDVTSMFISPGAQLQFAVDERDKAFQRNTAANQVDAYYSTGSRLGRGLSQAGGAVLGAASGGIGKGGGGGSGGGSGAYVPTSSYGGEELGNRYGG